MSPIGCGIPIDASKEEVISHGQNVVGYKGRAPPSMRENPTPINGEEPALTQYDREGGG
jgi:hypothetical protein